MIPEEIKKEIIQRADSYADSVIRKNISFIPEVFINKLDLEPEKLVVEKRDIMAAYTMGAGMMYKLLMVTMKK